MFNLALRIARNTLRDRFPLPVQRLLAQTVMKDRVASYAHLVDAPQSCWNSHGCIFVHIPKCAGVSIWTGLFGEVQVPAHLKLAHYYMILPPRTFNRAFKFCIVRNPWDRVVSAYEYFRQGGRFPHDRRWGEEVLGRYGSFDDFVQDWVTKDNVWRKEHFAPQSSFVCLRGKLAVDFVGRFESIGEDYEHIRARIGTGQPLPVLNKTEKRKDYREYYTDLSAERVAEVYATDIALFKYSFDEPTSAAH